MPEGSGRFGRMRLATRVFFAALAIQATYAQQALSARQIHQAEVLGRKTGIPLRLGTLIRAKNGKGFQAFITLPEQRVAYATSDMTSFAHGSLSKDPLESELHLNRMRVTGMLFIAGGSDAQSARHIVICSAAGGDCLQPAHEVLDVKQAVAEFDMPAVTKLAGPSGSIVIKIKTDAGKAEPDIDLKLSSLAKRSEQ